MHWVPRVCWLQQSASFGCTRALRLNYIYASVFVGYGKADHVWMFQVPSFDLSDESPSCEASEGAKRCLT